MSTSIQTSKSILTQSACSAFRDCRKKAQLRYEHGLVPLEDADALRFGSLVHDALAAVHGGQPWEQTLTAAAPEDAALAQAMVGGYIAKWGMAAWEAVAIETEFSFDIINPETGGQSRTFSAGGKWDGVVRIDGALWLLEHKTTSRVDAAYLERLWLDFQIAFYAVAIETVYREPCAGVIYNILEKGPKGDTAREMGETDAEWEARLAAAKAPGRCKRRMLESEADWLVRIGNYYADPARFHRETILFDRADLDLVKAETWEITQAWLDARRNGRWYRNTSQCYGRYGRPCEYLPLCRSRENPVVAANHYRIERPHTELAETPANTF